MSGRSNAPPFWKAASNCITTSWYRNAHTYDVLGFGMK